MWIVHLMSTEPVCSLRFRSDGVPLGINQHFAAPDMIG
jgi:hypothetical protein